MGPRRTAVILVSVVLPPVAPAAAIASPTSSALPSTTAPMTIVYGSGYVEVRDMFKAGMVSDVLRLLLLLAIGPPLAQALMTLKRILV